MGWMSAFIISMLTSILLGSNHIVYTWIYILTAIVIANAVSVKIMFKGEDVAGKYINMSINSRTPSGCINNRNVA